MLSTYSGAQEPALQRRASNRAVLSQALLSPALHSRPRALRFSRDGAYILLQDESAIYVFTREPLALRFAIQASEALPARFSSDSQALVVATRVAQVQRWNVTDGTISDTKTLLTNMDCFGAALSPDGELYACLDATAIVRVFRVATGEMIFDGRAGDSLPPQLSIILPFHRSLAYSQRFGYFVAHSLPTLPDPITAALSVEFSADGRYVIARSRFDKITAVDLPSRAKANLRGSVRHALEQGSLEFVAPDRVASVSSTKPEESVLLSFPGGATLSKLGVTGSGQATSDPRYLIHFPKDGKEAAVLDLQTNRIVTRIPKNGGDVLGSHVVTYTDDGEIVVANLGEEHPAARLKVPLAALPLLRTAVVSPGLEMLALGISGQGGVFRAATGERVARFDDLHGAWFENSQTCYLRVRETSGLNSTIEKVNTGDGQTTDAWSREDHPLRNESIFSGPALLAHVAPGIFVMMDQPRVGYDLHALDALTGRLLWSRKFLGSAAPRSIPLAPVAFTDPQGDRVVLGWPAKTDAAHDIAKRNPTVALAMKQAKVSVFDAVFEVLDGRTGKAVGAAFIQSGRGPESFDSAFSVGDWLILGRDYRRVTVLSLSTGKEWRQEQAGFPAASAESGLLSAAERGGRLALYDLHTGIWRSGYSFSANVVFSHFSSDGKRLLVLTEDQMVYVLDVANAAAASPATQP